MEPPRKLPSSCKTHRYNGIPHDWCRRLLLRAAAFPTTWLGQVLCHRSLSPRSKGFLTHSTCCKPGKMYKRQDQDSVTSGKRLCDIELHKTAYARPSQNFGTRIEVARSFAHNRTASRGEAAECEATPSSCFIMRGEKHVLVSALDITWPVAFALRKICAKICHMDLPSICWGLPLI